MQSNKLKIEIWSDVMCPFCYIGKRHIEQALKVSGLEDRVNIEWKSFQLNPDMKTDPSKNVNQYLAEIKGITVIQAEEMNARVTAMAKKAGLEYHFEKAVVANSFDAHRFTHLAKKHHLQDKAEEQLFKAYFTDGKNTADHEILIGLGTQIGMNGDEIRNVLESNDFVDDVLKDIHDASLFGIRGVPFFVFNRKYAISGAQPVEVFIDALNQIVQETANIN